MTNKDIRDRSIGKWIKAGRDGVVTYSDAYAECDQCHKVTFLGRRMKYCPNCGAYMGGKNEQNSPE